MGSRERPSQPEEGRTRSKDGSTRALKIFISYRRDDTSPFVDQLQSALRTRFPNVEVSRDIDVIAPGEDYVQVLQAEIDDADVFLAIIGPSWAGTHGKRRRLDDPNDVVRREISWRLRPRDSTQVILGGPGGSRIEPGSGQPPPPLLPVLVRGADMPGESTLPQDIRALAHLNAVSVSGSVERGFDFNPILDEFARRLNEHEKRNGEITADLEAIEAELGRESGISANPPPTASPQVRVNLSHFSHLGSWTCTIGSQPPGASAQLTADFEVRSDNSMSGHIVTKSRGLFRRRSRKEPMEGRADLLFLRPAGQDEMHPVIRLEGVRGGAQPFTLEIPIQRQLGQMFVGTSAGQSFALKQTRGHGL